MCIITKREEAVLRIVSPNPTEKKRLSGGFTIPELLAGLCIIFFCIQILVQIGSLAQQSWSYKEENRNAMLLAEQCRYGIQPEYETDWDVELQTEPFGNHLQLNEIVVHHDDRMWTFHYLTLEKGNTDAEEQ